MLHRWRLPEEVRCAVVGVAQSAYYDRFKQTLSLRTEEHSRLLRLIRDSDTASKGVFDAPRILLDLRKDGETCGMHRLARMMHENGLRALHEYRTRKCTIAIRADLAPNFQRRQFTASLPHVAWVTSKRGKGGSAWRSSWISSPDAPSAGQCGLPLLDLRWPCAADAPEALFARGGT